MDIYRQRCLREFVGEEPFTGLYREIRCRVMSGSATPPPPRVAFRRREVVRARARTSAARQAAAGPRTGEAGRGHPHRCPRSRSCVMDTRSHVERAGGAMEQAYRQADHYSRVAARGDVKRPAV